jgi:hypothetical protein
VGKTIEANQGQCYRPGIPSFLELAMSYAQLIGLYFERAAALQWYWTLYVVIIGGLLAFSSLRQRPDKITAALVLVLFAFFAYKNGTAIHEVLSQRNATYDLIKVYQPTNGENSPEWWSIKQFRDHAEGALVRQEWEGVRNFHMTSDGVTVLALLAMEWRRMRAKAEADKRAAV